MDGSLPTDGTRLSVVMNNTTCVLTLTDLRRSVGRILAHLSGTPTAAYASSASPLPPAALLELTVTTSANSETSAPFGARLLAHGVFTGNVR
jgi:hypothetical protein